MERRFNGNGWGITRTKEPAAQRFARYVDRSDGLFACWPWTGSRFPKGYGFFYFEGRSVRAHRFALEMSLGRPLQPGMQACHTCDNPPCCNPTHLYEGTNAQNVADRVARGGYATPRDDRGRFTTGQVGW